MKRFYLLLLLILLGLNLYCQQNADPANGKVKTIHLEKVKKIGTYWCKGWIRITGNGHLLGFDSASDIRMGQDIIPSGSRIRLFPSSRLRIALLAKNTIIQGYPCIGYGLESPETEFYESGRLKRCYLYEPRIIQGLPCKEGVFAEVIFHPGGQLRRCQLDQAVVIGNVPYTKDTYLDLDPTGKVLKSYKLMLPKRLFLDLLDLIL